MKICLRCFELKEMYHGRECKECRTKYIKIKKQEKNSKNCPICNKTHNMLTLECSDKCKILNRHIKINGCWEWQGKINESGYGSFQIIKDGYKTEVLSHRKSYEIFKGELLPGMQVCHSCDNPACCNPEHLWLGTSKENTQDSFKKNRRPNGKKRAIAAGKLSEDQVIEMREMYKNGISQKDIQEKFKISQSQVSGILRYKFWKHI